MGWRRWGGAGGNRPWNVSLAKPHIFTTRAATVAKVVLFFTSVCLWASVCKCNKWRLTDTDLCPCGETQTMSRIVKSCPLTKLNGGSSRLHSADEDKISWLTSYGTWNAYETKNATTLEPVEISWNFSGSKTRSKVWTSSKMATFWCTAASAWWFDVCHVLVKWRFGDKEILTFIPQYSINILINTGEEGKVGRPAKNFN